MICDCGLITKKRTLLDGIKSLSGTLIIFKIQNKDNGYDLFIKRCCFMTLIPPLYTFVDKRWLMHSDVLVFDPNTMQIHPEDTRTFDAGIVIQPSYKIQQSILDRLQVFGESEFKIKYILSARSIEPEYIKSIKSFKQAYQKVIELEQVVNQIRYKYSSVIHDNELLVASSTLNVNELDSNEHIPKECKRCEDIKSLKESLKELKQKSHDQINKTQYELKMNNQKIHKLETDISRLKEENAKLKEVNKSLYMNR